MPIRATHLTHDSTGSDATSYNTASITPHANKLILIAIGTQYGTPAPSISSVTGCGLTWVKVGDVTSSDNEQKLTVYRAMGTAPTSGALTINCSSTASRCNWSVDEFANVEKSGESGANAIVQTATNKTDGTSHTSLSISLSAFTNNLNATYGVIRMDGQLSPTVGADFTSLVLSNSVDTINPEFKNIPDTSVDWTFGATSARDQGIAIELKYSPDDGGAFILNMI